MYDIGKIVPTDSYLLEGLTPPACHVCLGPEDGQNSTPLLPTWSLRPGCLGILYGEAGELGQRGLSN